MSAKLSIPTVTNPEVAPAINAIKEVLEVGLGVRGDPSARFLTVADLTATGLVTTTRRGLVPVDPDTQAPVDLTPPAALTGLRATGAFTAILLEWSPSTAHNYAYTEVWRAEGNDRNAAVRIGTALGTLHTDPVDVGRAYWYWVRAVSTANVAGSWNAAYNEGVPGATSEATATLMAQLTEQIRPGQSVWREQVVYETDLFAIVSPRAAGDAGFKVPFVVGSVGGVSTVGIDGQLVVDGSITASAIRAGAVTADKISTLSLSAISANLGAVTAGSLDVGSVSWKVRISDTGYPLEFRNLYSGERKFYLDDQGNAFFKGAIEATSGTFAGAVQAGSTITGAAINGGTLNIGTPGFHVAANGDAWLGHASWASAPLRLETTGALHSGLAGASTHLSNGQLWSGSTAFSTALFRVDATGAVASGLGSASTNLNNGQLWTGASSFASAPFRVDSAGNLWATRINGATMLTTPSTPQPEIGSLYIDAARVKNLTADRILTGVLGAGVIVSGALISGEITTASLHANRITGDVNKIVTVDSYPSISAGMNVWTNVGSILIPAPGTTRGHRIVVSLGLRMEHLTADVAVAARVLCYGVEIAYADTHIARASVLPLLGSHPAIFITTQLLTVQAMTTTGTTPAIATKLAGTAMGISLTS
jgi:hypothetical protein